MDETYYIVNVDSEYYAALLDTTDRLEIVNMNDRTHRGSEWFISHIKKDKYWFQNAGARSFACYDNRPQAGGQVLGKWPQEDIKPSGSVWRIRPTPGPEISYTISPSENPDIFWRSFRDEGTPLELSLPWTARHCQWIFKPVRAGTKLSPIIRCRAADGHMYITRRLLETLPNHKQDAIELAFEIASTIRDITKLPGVEDNLDVVEQRIVATAAQLIIAHNALIESKSKRSEGDPWLSQLRNVLQNEFANLYRVRSRSAHAADPEDEKRRIAEIFEHINEAKLQFELGIEIRAFKNTYEIKEHIRTFILDRLKPSRKANHKYDLEGNERKLLRRSICTPGTRVDLLDTIINWARDTSPGSPDVYWLFGSAGSGKSTIAYTVARRFEFTGDPNSTVILGGNFFCSRQFEETKQAKHIVPTIAYHLSLACKPFADALREFGTFEAIDHDVQAQFQGLLVKPWQESESARLSDPTSARHYLVIIDALDEIDAGGGSKFLGNFFTIMNKSQFNGLKFFAASRPDPALVDLVDSFQQDRRHRYRLEDVDRTAISDDIRRYLTAELPHYANREEMEKLVTLADGLFISAATVVRYMADVGRFKQEYLLKRLLSLSDSAVPKRSDEERSWLDGLYYQILVDAFGDVDEDFYDPLLQILHTLLRAPERTSTTVAAELICPPDERDLYIESATDVVNKLHAVLYTESGRVFSYHKSFSDFLFSINRCQKFWCDPAVLQRCLTEPCFREMSVGLRFNIANIRSSFILDSDNTTLSADVERNISAFLSYSCRNWAHHLGSVCSTDLDLFCRLLSDFLRLRALFWIEAMNLLGAGGDCGSTFRMASDRVRTLDPALSNSFTEAANFSVHFSGSSAAMSTPHLYISALATWPGNADPSRIWKASFHRLPAFTNDIGAGNMPLLNLRLESSVHAVGCSSDGMRIVSGASDRSVRVWDASTGNQLKVLKGHTDKVRSVAFSNDGTRIVSGSNDQSVRVWDASTGKVLKVLKGHTNTVSSVTFSSDGTQIASGSYDGSVLVWDASTGKELKVLKGHTSPVSSVALSNDGTRIVSGSSSESVRVWDASTGKQLKLLQGHTYQVNSVAFSNDGMRIVSGSGDRSIRVWDASTGKQLKVLKGHTNLVLSVAFSNDGTRIVSGSYDESVRVWDASTGEQLKVLKGHTACVSSVVFSNNGTRIVSGSWDQLVRVWDASTGNELKVRSGFRNWVRSVAFTGSGGRIVSSADDNLWEVSTGQRAQALKGHTGWVRSVAFSNDGTRSVSGSADELVRVWDGSTGKQLKVLKGHGSSVNSVAFSNDDIRIVSGSGDGSVRVWDGSTGKQLKVLKGHTNAVSSVTFSSDGMRIASGSYDGSVLVRDGSTGKQLKVLKGHTSCVNSVAFSNDGTRIVSGSSDQSVQMWDASTGNQLKVLKGHTDQVLSVAFSNDGMRIVSGSYDESVRVWDVLTGKQLKVLKGHTNWVYSAAFSNNGTQIVSGSTDKSVWVWDTSTGERLKVLKGHTDLVLSVAFSNNGTWIVSGSVDESVQVWDLSMKPRYLQEHRIEASGGVKYTGWLLSPSGKDYLMSVPLSVNLPDDCNTLTISRMADASVDFTGAKLGTQWHECYKP